MGDLWDVIPADTFMEILRHLPPSPRRRLRLVCRHWRDVIDDRVPRKQARAKVLAFAQGHGVPRAIVIEDLTEKLTGGGGGGRYLKLQANRGTSIVGTCNGLLCLHRTNGAVFIVNPVTGEKLAVPLPPTKTSPAGISYTFAYHPATGLYKVVNIPSGTFDAVNVFTLGDRSWREVPVPVGTSCLLGFGLISTGGATYWVATDGHSLMSFDLKDELVAFVTKLPVWVGIWQDVSYHLTTDVSGRLGLAVCSKGSRRSRWTKTQKRTIRTKVWMMQDRRRNKARKWVLQYKIVWPGQEPRQEIAWPYATDGEHLLATRVHRLGNSMSLLVHRLGEARAYDGVVRAECTPPLICRYDDCHGIRTFAHVETTEPLALYRSDDDEKIAGDCMEWVWKFDRGEGRWKLVRGEIL